MRRPTVALAFLGITLGAGGTVLFADDPAPPRPAPSAPAAEPAGEIQQRVEDLGSADFRVREAAWKALVGYGERARPALEAALKSENPSVRFRAEQLLARLAGGAAERALDDGTNSAPALPVPGGTSGGLVPVGPGRFFTDEDFARLMRETEARMKQFEEDMRRRVGNGGLSFPTPWLGVDPRMSPFLAGRADRDLRVHVDGGELRESGRGARLQLTEKAANGASKTTVYEARTLDALFEAYPDVKESLVVKALLERKAAEEAARAAREAQRKGPGASPALRSTNKSVTVQSTDGKTTVTITETGPDGKSVSRTYEGSDLESIRRDHPELSESLGGMRIQIGPMSGPWARGGPAREPADDDEPLDFGEPGAGMTGPFGLGLAPVDDALRQHLRLDAGRGAVVAVVRPDSDAAKLGLVANDVITAINATPVTGPPHVAELIRGAKDGALAIDVLRAGQPLTLRR